MANVVKHKRSSTSGETPSASDLDVGEIAVNTADGKLFVKHTDGTVVEISGGGGGGSVSTLSDTTITSLGDGELLVYDTTSSNWINQTLSEAGIAALASPGLTGTPTAPTASAATNNTQIATTSYVTTAVSNLVDSAPGALNTLNELAAALGDDANFSTTVTNSIATKLPLAGGTLSGNLGINKSLNSAVSLSVKANTTATNSYGLEVTNSSQNTRFLVDGVGSSFFYKTDNAVGMKFDSSSGHLLHSKTSPDGFVVGHELRHDSFAIHTVSGGAALYARRIGSGTNDQGDIQVFQNNDGTVGSIGANGGDLYIENGTTGISFNNSHNSIIPTTTGGNVDDANQNLGISSHRWKDLFLSGSVNAATGTYTGDVQAAGLYVGATNTSYDFYNNGTSYLNGAVTIDDSLLSGDIHIKSGTSGTNTQGLLFSLTDNADAQAYIKKTSYYMHYNANSNEGHRFTVSGSNDLLRMHGNTNGTRPDSIDILASNGLYMGNTQVMTLGRALTNITGGTVAGDLTVNGVTFKSGSNVSRNLKIQPSSSTSDVGASFFNGAGNWTMQLYGYNSGSTQQYGFLDANWASWDIQKVPSGAFKVDEGSGLQRVFNDGYHPNADAWTTSRTLSLTGDASGSVSWDGSANATLSVTVANDSHTHDGRYFTETEADSRFVNVAGDTMTGHLGIGGTATDASWGDATYGNTEVSIDGGGGYGVLHFRGDGAGSTDTRYSVGVGDSIFYMAYDDVDGVHRAKINASHQLILNEGSGDVRAFHDGYHPNADAWTTSRTLSLTGDVSGSVSWDGSANASITSTVDKIDGIGFRNGNNTNGTNPNNIADNGTSYINSISLFGQTDGALYSQAYSSSWVHQIFGDYRTGQLAIRGKNNGTFTSWSTVWSSNNDGSGSGLDADTVDGIHASSIFYDKGTSQIGSSSSWDVTAPGMYGVGSGSTFTGTNNPSSAISGIYTYGVLNVFEANGNGIAQLYTPHTGNKIAIRTGWNNGSWYPWQQVWTSTSDGSGSGLDADLLDGVQGSSYLRSDADDTYAGNLTVNGVTFKNDSNTTRNLKIQPTGSDASVGLSMYLGNGNHSIQLYGNATEYGFLDANWANWDIKKTKNGAFQVDEGGGLQRVFNDGYHPNADTLTTARTINGVSFNGSANITVADSTKLPLSGGTVTGDLTVTGGAGAISVNAGSDIRFTTGNWTGEHTGKIQYHSDSMYFQAANAWYFRDSSAVNLVTFDNSGNTFATTSHRAPIFYDTNDTAYYVDPASRSVMGSIDFNQSISETSQGGRVGKNYLYNTLELQGYGAELMIGAQSTSIHINYRPCNSGTSGHTPTTWYWRAGSSTSFSTHNFGAVTSNGILTATSDARAPLFYDSNNTAYYADPASDSKFNNLDTYNYVTVGGGANAATNNPYNSVSSTKLMFGARDSNAQGSYHIGTSMENFGGNYTKLDFRWHTGIRMGANAAYGGVRIFDSESLGTRLFSVGEGDTHVRVSNNIYAKVFYDFDDTAYYVDPATLSRVYRIMAGGTIDSTPNGTQFSNVLGAVTVGGQSGRACYFDGGGVGASVWWGNGNSPYGAIDSNQSSGLLFYYNNSSGAWSEQFRVSDGYVYAINQSRAPIFYDSNDTAYYVNPNGTSRLSQIDFGDSSPTLSGNQDYLQVQTSYGYIQAGPANSTYAHINTDRANFYFNQTVYVDGSGIRMYDSSADVRSFAFYDQANTSYYFDGSATGDSIRVAGNIVAYYSDERLKDIEGNIDSPLEKVSQLNGFYYKANKKAQTLGYKDNRQVGVSAQEVEAVMPEVVTDAAIGHGYKTVDYAKLVPLLIEAVKQQQDQIETLKARLTKLES